MIQDGAQSRLWEAMRGKLARLFGKATVQELPLSTIGERINQRRSEDLHWAIPALGVRQWQLVAASVLWEAPAALAGSGGADLAKLQCVTIANAVPHLDAESVLGQDVIVGQPVTRELAVGQSELRMDSAYSVTLKLEQPPIQSLPITMSTANVRLASLQKKTLLQTTKRDVLIKTPTVRARLDAAVRIPMTVKRIGNMAQYRDYGAYEKERLHLTLANEATLEDIALLACYPHVPLAWVQQMAVIDDGAALRLWLRPAATKTGRTPGLVTIVLGRRRSTGETIRAVLPEAQSASKV